MRKVIVWEMMTLDGYFEGSKPWEIDYHEYVWGPELERFSLEAAPTPELSARVSSWLFWSWFREPLDLVTLLGR